VEGEDLPTAAEGALGADDQLVAGDGRRGPGVVTRDAAGGGDAGPPPLLAGPLVDGVEVARPIREVHGIAVDRRCGRHVAAGRELPLLLEPGNVAHAERLLVRLEPGVLKVAAGRDPRGPRRDSRQRQEPDERHPD
jgi:hypothetical protein